MAGIRVGKESAPKVETTKKPVSNDFTSQNAEQWDIIKLQKHVGNRTVQRLKQDGRLKGHPEILQFDPAVESFEIGAGERSPSSLQRVPDDQEQNIVMDALGWVGDLVRVLGWGTLAGGPQRGRAAIHLMHNMFGSGEPITVPKEWVMDSPDWQETYRNLLTGWVEHVVTDAATRDMAGESEGSDYFSDTASATSLPDSTCVFPIPMCQGSDQFLGSGAATFTVEGDYMWRLTNDPMPVLQIDIFNLTGSYEDRYDWHHEADPGQFSRQGRGWYTPFVLSSSWDEPDRVERRLRAVGLPPGSLRYGSLEDIH